MAHARVLLADDSQVVLDALVELIERAPDISVVAAVHDGGSALERAVELRPDVAVVDVRMPGGGPELVERLLAALPGLCVIGLSSVSAGSVAAAMIAAGACRYLVKGDPGLDLVATIRDPRA